MRPSREEVVIAYTKMVAQRGTCERSRVGAVLAIDGRPISAGYNGAPVGESHCTEVGCFIVEGHCVRSIHAEANCIGWAARRGISTEGATMYVYGWKFGVGACKSCELLCKAAGIEKIVAIPFEEDGR